MNTMFLTVDESTMLLIAGGVMLCSLLCVFASLRNGGKMIQKPIPMLLCQFYLMMTALLQLTFLADGFITRVLGLLIFALGAVPAALKKNSFQGARYCIAFGAVLTAFAMLF